MNYVMYNMGMRVFRTKREECGFSQRELAARAGIAYKTLQLLESGHHDPRWSTLVKIAQALGQTGHDPEQVLASFLGMGGNSAAEVATRILKEGTSSWKLWLFQFVDAFRSRPDYGLLAVAPDPQLSHPIQALLASTVEFLCQEYKLPIPWWCAGVPPLPRPWFVADVENLKASALTESAAQFRRRNIFVLGNFLDRA
ncbi:MAG: helix-turn-helix transcriptional regulator [Elusimicrobia bacterium]|nr:helix-turn-helix transcriptional regulator [Elusimicrobiota bacterium]